MKVALSWISGKKEYRYPGIGVPLAEGERQSVEVEGGELVYERAFPDNDGGYGVAIVGYVPQQGEPPVPLGAVLPVSHSAIPLTVIVESAREVVATAEELERLDGIEVDGELRYARGASGLRYVRAGSGSAGGDNGDGERQDEPERPWPLDEAGKAEPQATGRLDATPSGLEEEMMQFIERLNASEDADMDSFLSSRTGYDAGSTAKTQAFDDGMGF